MSLNSLVKQLPSIRLTFLIVFLGSIFLIMFGLYLQHVKGLEPCALCITQRVFFISAGIVGLIAFIANFKGIGRRIISGVGVLLAGFGGSISIRQLYLQSLPEDQAPACGPGLAYAFENFPVFEALSLLLQGDGNCAEVVWTMFGISIPGWALISFTGMVVVYTWQALRPNTEI